MDRTEAPQRRRHQEAELQGARQDIGDFVETRHAVSLQRQTPEAHPLLDIYLRLMARYGPQHWWPAQAPFEVMVGAILTQSAAWVNVEKGIARLRQAGALTPAALRELPLDTLAELVHPCGYYNAKARKLKALAEWLDKECADSLDRLFARDTYLLRQQLLAVHGIGPETADSILLYAAGKPVFVIDAYTRRIMGRVGAAPVDSPYHELQQVFTNHLPADAPLFNEYHALLVCHGKNVCRRKPVCQECCLDGLCADFRNSPSRQ